jgi:hypothetical protein
MLPNVVSSPFDLVLVLKVLWLDFVTFREKGEMLYKLFSSWNGHTPIR